MADCTSRQPTYSIKAFMSQPWSLAQLAKPRRNEWLLWSPASAKPALVSNSRSRRTKLLGCRPSALTWPHWLTARNTGPSCRSAACSHAWVASTGHNRDSAGTLAQPGFARLAARHWRMGAAEMARDWSKRLFLRSLRRLVPELQLDHLAPGPSGVRAQLLERDGTLVDDFVLGGEGRILHVLNAPSPAATASLAIGDELAARAAARFGLSG